MSVGAIERLDRIRERLVEHGRVRVSDLAAKLDVSEMTIRRDLDALADEGVVQRVHGGAIAIGPQRFGERFAQQGRAKDIIASKLIEMVPFVGTIGLDASSTMQRLAMHIDHTQDLTVMTNGLENVNALNGRLGVKATLTGGRVSATTGSLVGPIAASTARELLYDLVFVSALGVDAAIGSSEPTLEEVEVKRSMAANSGQVVLAVDHTKLGLRAPARAFAWADVDLLVTDLDPSDGRLDPYRGEVEVR